MAVSSKELELLILSEKRYTLYVVVLVLVSAALFYFFGPLLPWKVDHLRVIFALLALLLYTAAARAVTPKRFAKIGLYSEIFVNVCIIAFIAYFSGGIISPLNIAFIIPITFAVFLIGARFGWITWGFTILALASLIFLPAGLPLSKLQAVSFFLLYTVLISYLASVFLLLRELLVRLEGARKAAQERVALLENITRRLQTLDRLKMEFVTRASHQLRTPLSKLKWGFEELFAGTEGPVPENQKALLQPMAASVDDLIRLAKELLDISKLESEGVEYVMEKVDLAPLVKSILEEYASEIKKKELNVSFKEENDAYVKGELRGLEIALHIIIENAIQYTPSKGSIKIFFTGEGELQSIHVRDSGIGISQDERKFLFTAFYRGPRAARMVANGTGLGLFMAKDIVTKHHGKILLESEEGKGTEVIISLPAFSSP